MKSGNLSISMQHIQIFLKAVELRNFSQVAYQLNFSPSMVSKTISFLEDNLGIRLFIRKPHALVPTPAALYLASEWRQYIGAFENSVKNAKLYAEKQSQTIVFGFVDSSTQVDHFISSLVSNYLSTHSDTAIVCEKHDMHRAAELLNTGMLSLIQSSDMIVPYLDTHNLSWQTLVDTRVAAFVPCGNELFERENIDFSDIVKQPLFILNEQMNPSYSQWLLDICRKHGFTPQIAASFRTVRSLIFNLRLSKNIFIGNSITSDWCDDNLKMFTLPEMSSSIVAWSDNDAGEILKFKDYLVGCYQKEHPEGL